MYISDCC